MQNGFGMKVRTSWYVPYHIILYKQYALGKIIYVAHMLLYKFIKNNSEGINVK